jgi:hypothetical protein
LTYTPQAGYTEVIAFSLQERQLRWCERFNSMTTPHDDIQRGTQHGIQHGDHGHHAAPLPFSDGDIEGFRKEDIHAGTMVVGLMTGIFSIGVFIYVIVALTVGPSV